MESFARAAASFVARAKASGTDDGGVVLVCSFGCVVVAAGGARTVTSSTSGGGAATGVVVPMRWSPFGRHGYRPSSKYTSDVCTNLSSLGSQMT